MTRIAIIHITTATVETFKALAAEMLPGCHVINIVDDSILPLLAENGGNIEPIRERMVQYACLAQQSGAGIALEACSSVGELVAEMRAAVSIPVIRVDEAMAEAAVTRADRIGVAATLPTTLGPTSRLLQQKAAAMGKAVEMQTLLIEGAYQKLMSGDRAGHDQLLCAGLAELAARTDMVVLAQASMARVVPGLPAGLQGKFLTSPRLAVEQMQRTLNASSVH